MIRKFAAMEKSTIFVCFLLLNQALGFKLQTRRRSNSTGGKIVGGEEIEISQAPYQVLLLEALGNDEANECGGSIISPNFILTAAHCTYGTNEKNWTVYAGSNILAAGEQYKVKKITNHPRYVAATKNYDFALMELATKMTLEDEVKEVIELPARNDKIADGTAGFVSGWGDVEESGASSDVLRGVTVFTVKQSDCMKAYPTMTNKMFCAGVPGGGKDSCQVCIFELF